VSVAVACLHPSHADLQHVSHMVLRSLNNGLHVLRDLEPGGELSLRTAVKYDAPECCVVDNAERPCILRTPGGTLDTATTLSATHPRTHLVSADAPHFTISEGSGAVADLPCSRSCKRSRDAAIQIITKHRAYLIGRTRLVSLCKSVVTTAVPNMFP